MIRLVEYVNQYISQPCFAAGKRIALRLASCGAVIRPPSFAAALSAWSGGLFHPPLTIPPAQGVPPVYPAQGPCPMYPRRRRSAPAPLTMAFRPWTLTNPRRFGYAPRREATP